MESRVTVYRYRSLWQVLKWTVLLGLAIGTVLIFFTEPTTVRRVPDPATQLVRDAMPWASLLATIGGIFRYVKFMLAYFNERVVIESGEVNYFDFRGKKQLSFNVQEVRGIREIKDDRASGWQVETTRGKMSIYKFVPKAKEFLAAIARMNRVQIEPRPTALHKSAIKVQSLWNAVRPQPVATFGVGSAHGEESKGVAVEDRA